MAGVSSLESASHFKLSTAKYSIQMTSFFWCRRRLWDALSNHQGMIARRQDHESWHGRNAGEEWDCIRRSLGPLEKTRGSRDDAFRVSSSPCSLAFLCESSWRPTA